MKRREFIAVLGGAAVARPLGALAQQQAMPIIGLLSSVPFETRRDQLAGFHRGLRESGHVEGTNVAIEYRTANNQVSQLPNLAAELLDRRVAVIVTIGGDIVALAAKASTATIPIVFVTGFDPVKAGLVASMNRPGGNVTGVSILVSDTAARRLQLLSEIAPSATRIGMLTNPDNANAERNATYTLAAAKVLERQLVVVKARTELDIDAAFTVLVAKQVGAVIIDSDPFFLGRREQLVGLAALHSLPAIYSVREFTEIGGLMSYGTSLANAYHQAGIYAAKILAGEKPADLPVIQPTKFEMAINQRTAEALRLTVPPTLQVGADEVIE